MDHHSPARISSRTSKRKWSHSPVRKRHHWTICLPPKKLFSCSLRRLSSSLYKVLLILPTRLLLEPFRLLLLVSHTCRPLAATVAVSRPLSVTAYSTSLYVAAQWMTRFPQCIGSDPENFTSISKSHSIHYAKRSGFSWTGYRA